jgi:hypothetical protein
MLSTSNPVDHGERHIRRVGDHGQIVAFGERTGDRQVGRAGIDEQDLTAADQLRGDRGEGTLALDVLVAALGERRGVRHEQCAAVDALAQAARGEVAKIAADRVLGDAELDGEIGGDDSAVPPQALDDAILALARQRGVACCGGRHHHRRTPRLVSASRSCAGERKWMPCMPSATAASTLPAVSSMNTARVASIW